MLKRAAFLGYGVACYLVFFGTFLYAVGFIGGFGVPTRLDGPASGATGTALVVDAALLGLFAVQHSVMARRWFKERWTRLVPPPLERSTYVLFSSLALIALFAFWQPLGGRVWSFAEGPARAILHALFAFGCGLVLVCTFLINHFDLFGLRQVYLRLRGQTYTELGFRTPFLYKFMRHPMMLGFLIAFWSAPHMTAGRLLFAVATSGFILIAIQLEERDLIQFFGDTYREYRKRTPMLIPRLFKK